MSKKTYLKTIKHLLKKLTKEDDLKRVHALTEYLSMQQEVK